jgi:hypothetical protein
MTIEVVLLIIETVLLVATVLLLVYSIREASRRKELLLKVGRATEVLTRVEYFSMVNRSIIEANEEVIGYVTGARPTGPDEREIRGILDVIQTSSSRGIKIRYILPRLQDRLYMGYKYLKAGAEIKFKRGTITQSLRYMVIDSSEVVIGIPERIGRREMTRKGHWLPSKALAGILRRQFNTNWEKGIDFYKYVDEVLKETGISIDNLAIELGIEPKEFENELSAFLEQHRT